MIVSEFKAWFEGYTEAMKDVPSAKQWARIKERIAEIDGKPVSERVFIDRYWPGYVYPSYYWHGSGVTSPTYRFNTSGSPTVTNSNEIYCSSTAMYSLGKAESSI